MQELDAGEEGPQQLPCVCLVVRGLLSDTVEELASLHELGHEVVVLGLVVHLRVRQGMFGSGLV